jgi:hypothetical protein
VTRPEDSKTAPQAPEEILHYVNWKFVTRLFEKRLEAAATGAGFDQPITSRNMKRDYHDLADGARSSRLQRKGIGASNAMATRLRQTNRKLEPADWGKVVRFRLMK